MSSVTITFEFPYGSSAEPIATVLNFQKSLDKQQYAGLLALLSDAETLYFNGRTVAISQEE